MPTKARSARREPMAGANHPPTWIKPQLAALVKEAPDGPDWLHELKLDGYCMHARLAQLAVPSALLQAEPRVNIDRGGAKASATHRRHRSTFHPTRQLDPAPLNAGFG